MATDVENVPHLKRLNGQVISLLLTAIFAKFVPLDAGPSSGDLKAAGWH